MKTTPKQDHVLSNLNRVVPLASQSVLPRYQLDGVECTAQLRGLAVRKVIARHSSGQYMRLRPTTVADKLVGERQVPLSATLEAIRAALSTPATVRTISVIKR